MTPQDLRHSAENDAGPSAALHPALQALWFTKAGRWEEAHDLAQEIHTPEGSWIHALLHLIEGDAGNAGYWFARAGRKPAGAQDTAAEWDRIAAHLLKAQTPGA